MKEGPIPASSSGESCSKSGTSLTSTLGTAQLRDRSPFWPLSWPVSWFPSAGGGGSFDASIQRIGSLVSPGSAERRDKTGQCVRSPLVTVTPLALQPSILLICKPRAGDLLAAGWIHGSSRMTSSCSPLALLCSPSPVHFLVVHRSLDPEDAVQGSNPDVNSC